MFILLLISFFIEIILSDDKNGITLTKDLTNLNVIENGITPNISIEKEEGIYYFEIEPKDENSLFNITFYKNNYDPNKNFTERYLNQKKPLIYLDSNISQVKNKRILITCSPECNYVLSYQILDYFILKDNSNFSLYYQYKSLNKTIYYKTEITDLNSNNILINVMGKSIEDFPISFRYENQSIKSEKNFINGKGLLITKNNGITLDSNKTFFIEYTSLGYDSVTFSSRIIKLNENIPTTEIDLLSETYVVLNKNFSKECFSVKSDNKDVIYI